LYFHAEILSKISTGEPKNVDIGGEGYAKLSGLITHYTQELYHSVPHKYVWSLRIKNTFREKLIHLKENTGNTIYALEKIVKSPKNKT
jgi:hypothetical protein